MEVVSCKDEFSHINKNSYALSHGYVIKHNQPSGWMGTTTGYIGWYRYKKHAIERMEELKKTL